jgi:S-adenosylmethionine-diacylgycerolhomoserine-N-methlytransferase
MSAEKMDAMYRVQRHFYDLTRKPYLLGRDTLIQNLAVQDRETVLEIGCGTARNLIRIARAYPSAKCFGADISAAMLETARAAINRSGLDNRITVAQADATALNAKALFGLEQFDRVVISYALSMIPDWEGALYSAMRLLSPNGALHIADFGDQAGLPKWFRSALWSWLKVFSVVPRLQLPDTANGMAATLGCECRSRALYGGYVFLGEIRAQTWEPRRPS